MTTRDEDARAYALQQARQELRELESVRDVLAHEIHALGERIAELESETPVALDAHDN